MKLTLITRHFFSAHNRKTTVHFISREFSKRGYQVNFISVGRSRLSTINKSEGKGIPKDLSRRNFTEVEPRIFSIVMDEWVHPISASSGSVRSLTSPGLIRYGKNLPDNIKSEVLDSDIVLIECGYGVAYFEYLKAICSKAKFVYFATDPLTQVGLRKEFEAIEMDAVTKFDLVRVASKSLGERFPKQTNLAVIPQGLDKSVFDTAEITPYSADSRNIVSIGDMSFDYHAVVKMATLKPNIHFHIFGADIPIEYPKNIKVYGEVRFEELVPYIKFADAGIMAYKMNADMAYLTKTSLKFLQYSYCRLPIITPYGADWQRGGVFQYDANSKDSINEALDSALVATKEESLAEGILDWGECTDQLLSLL